MRRVKRSHEGSKAEQGSGYLFCCRIVDTDEPQTQFSHPKCFQPVVFMLNLYRLLLTLDLYVKEFQHVLGSALDVK